MCFTPRASGHRPGVPRVPGEALVRRPVLGDGRLPECYDFEAVPLGVLEKLHVHTLLADQRVVAARQRQVAGDMVYVCRVRQLVSACPATVHMD